MNWPCTKSTGIIAGSLDLSCAETIEVGINSHVDQPVHCGRIHFMVVINSII